MLGLGALRPKWKSSQTGKDFKALSLNWSRPNSKLTPRKKPTKRTAISQPLCSAYKLSTHKPIPYNLNYKVPGLGRLLKEKQRLRKLWQETRDPACKMVVNWISREPLAEWPRERHLNDGKQNWVTVRSLLKQPGLLRNPSSEGKDQRR